MNYLESLRPESGLSSASEAMSPSIVRLRGVDYHFGEKHFRKQVLFNIELEVGPGEIVIMSGPSGSGKTTILTLVGAIRSPQSGSVQIFGRELAGLSHQELVQVRRDIGFIFQQHNLFESLTALQNVKMALQFEELPSRESEQRACLMLDRLRLADRTHAKPNALSGGQRQRVAVARALVHRPQLILADEPTAALDRDTGRVVVELLRERAKQEGSAVMLVTHDNRILDIADHIVNVVDGRIASNVAVKEAVVVCQFLTNCPVFSELTPAALTEVADKMERERYGSGTRVIEQGDPGDKFYLIRGGLVDIVRNGDLVATLGEGDFFGEAALLTGEPRNATAVVKEDAELYVLGKEGFESALSRSASFKSQLLGIFFQRQP